MKKTKGSDLSKESYLKAGAEMRLFKTLSLRMQRDVGAVLPAAERHRLVKAMNMIEELCPVAEGRMLLSGTVSPFWWTEVFYGPTDRKPMNEVDEMVLAMAREVADELFERKGD